VDQPPPPASPAADASPPAAPPRVPIALIGAIALMFITNLVIGLAFARIVGAREFQSEAMTRWSLLDTGFDFAFLALALAGALDLVRRTSGQARTGARVVLAAVLVLAALAVLSQYINRIYLQRHQSDPEVYRQIWAWSSRIRTTAWLALVTGTLVAGWRVPIVRTLAAPLIVATLIATPYDFYASYIYGLFGSGRYSHTIGSSVLHAVSNGLLIAVLWKGAPAIEADGGWSRAATALDRTAGALYARLWIAVSGALLVLVLFGSQGSGGDSIAKLWTVGIPLANAIAGLVLVSGLLGAAGLTAPRAPRLRLYGAGTALMVTVAISSLQVLFLMRVLLGDHDDYDSTGRELMQALPVLMPVIGLAGMVLLAAGLHGVAAALDSPQLKGQATASITTVVICQLVAIGIPYLLATARELTPGTALLGLLAAAAAAVIALVSLARLCRALATGLRARHELPTATLLARTP